VDINIQVLRSDHESEVNLARTHKQRYCKGLLNTQPPQT